MKIENMHSKGKYLALDYGDRRVGMAISNIDKDISFPRDFLEYNKVSELIDTLEVFCETEGVSRIILGFPLHMDGQVGDRARKTQQFHTKLKAAMPGMDIIFFDERLSTEFAVKALRGQGIKAKDQRGKRDMMSAQIILQNYLASIS